MKRQAVPGTPAGRLRARCPERLPEEASSLVWVGSTKEAESSQGTATQDEQTKQQIQLHRQHLHQRLLPDEASSLDGC